MANTFGPNIGSASAGGFAAIPVKTDDYYLYPFKANIVTGVVENLTDPGYSQYAPTLSALQLSALTTILKKLLTSAVAAGADPTLEPAAYLRKLVGIVSLQSGYDIEIVADSLGGDVYALNGESLDSSNVGVQVSDMLLYIPNSAAAGLFTGSGADAGSGSATPIGPAGGVLRGTYPDPSSLASDVSGDVPVLPFNAADTFVRFGTATKTGADNGIDFIVQGGGVSGTGIGGGIQLNGAQGSSRGGNIDLLGGLGSAGPGGGIALTAGTGSTDGGGISITAGQGNGGLGGTVDIYGGQGTNTDGGEVRIEGGAGTGVGDGGELTLLAGAGPGGGDIVLAAGAGSVGAGGFVQMRGGDGATNGGYFQILGGAGGSGVAGAAILRGGDSSGAAGGAASVDAGTGTTNGDVTVGGTNAEGVYFGRSTKTVANLGRAADYPVAQTVAAGDTVLASRSVVYLSSAGAISLSATTPVQDLGDGGVSGNVGGDIVTLINVGANNITIPTGGNVLLAGGAAATLGAYGSITLRYLARKTSGIIQKWVEISRVSSAS